jgi:O-antigen/teichoic acid export membrane protein
VRLTFYWTFLEAAFSILASYIRARGWLTGFAILRVGLAVGKLVIIIYMAYSGYTLETVILVLVALESLFIVIILAIIIKDIGIPQPNFKGLSVFLAFSLPQVPAGVLMWIISASDRFFITHFLNLSETGIYSSSRLLGGGAIELFFSPIGYVLLPTLSRLWEEGRHSAVKTYLQYSTKLFLTLAIPVSTGLFFISQPLLRIFTTSEFMSSAGLVVLVAAGSIFLGIFNINEAIVLLIKKTKWFPPIILAASATSAGMNILLIPRIGILGSAISSIAAYFVLAAIVSIWARKIIKYGIDFVYLGKVVLASAIMGAVLWLMHINSTAGIILGVVIGTTLFGCTLLALRAFSKQDVQLIKDSISGWIPRLR